MNVKRLISAMRIHMTFVGLILNVKKKIETLKEMWESVGGNIG